MTLRNTARVIGSCSTEILLIPYKKTNTRVVGHGEKDIV